MADDLDIDDLLEAPYKKEDSEVRTIGDLLLSLKLFASQKLKIFVSTRRQCNS